MFQTQYSFDEKIAQDFAVSRFGITSKIVIDDSLPLMLPVDVTVAKSDQRNCEIIIKLRPETTELLSKNSGYEKYLENLIALKGNIYIKHLIGCDDKCHYFKFENNTVFNRSNDSVYLGEIISDRLIRDTSTDNFKDNHSLFLKNKVLLVYDLFKAFISYNAVRKDKTENALINAGIVFDKKLMNELYQTLDISNQLNHDGAPNRTLVRKLFDVYDFLKHSAPYGTLELQLKYFTEEVLANIFDIKSPHSLVNVCSYLSTKANNGEQEIVDVNYVESKLGNGNKEYFISIYISEDAHETLLTSANEEQISGIFRSIKSKIQEKIDAY